FVRGSVYSDTRGGAIMRSHLLFLTLALLTLPLSLRADPPPFYPLPVPSWYTGPYRQPPFGSVYPEGSFIPGRAPWLPAYDHHLEAGRLLQRGLALMKRN